jgi:hypothetical protein
VPSPTPIPDAAVEALLESRMSRLEEGLNRLNEKSRAALRAEVRGMNRSDVPERRFVVRCLACGYIAGEGVAPFGEWRRSGCPRPYPAAKGNGEHGPSETTEVALATDHENTVATQQKRRSLLRQRIWPNQPGPHCSRGNGGVMARKYMPGGEPGGTCPCGRPSPGIMPGGGCWCSVEDLPPEESPVWVALTRADIATLTTKPSRVSPSAKRKARGKLRAALEEADNG